MLTQELLLELFSYDPITGIVTNKVTRNGSCVAGKRAGSLEDNGYRRIGLMYNKYGEHQLIWFMVYGWWPDEIDHINGIRDDNRLCNLREVNRSQNRMNASPSAASGYRGVTQYANEKYGAAIQVEGKSIHLGTFSSAEEASEAYKKAAEQYQGEYAFHLSRNLP